MYYVYIPSLNQNYYPLDMTLNCAELNEELQHVEASCDVKVDFESALFEKLITNKEIPAVVKKEEDNSVVFTGVIKNDISWTDEGTPTPISNITLKIQDYTCKLAKKTTDEVALITTTLKAVIQKIATDCNITVEDYADTQLVSIQAFVLDEDKQYLEALNSILFQYCYYFYFNSEGNLVVSKLLSIPDSLPELSESDFYVSPTIAKSSKNYDKVSVKYNTLTKKTNEQVYFAGNDLDSDQHITPITLRPGQYYPYESAPEQEAREGKIQQTFESGYAESYTTYAGETKYRRSQKTTLLYTENHYVVEDWEGAIEIDRTEFGSRKAAVRLLNTSRTTDASLYQFSIRADAYYRTSDSTITYGTGNSEFSYESEYIYDVTSAENLGALLSRFFINTSFKIKGKISSELPVGSYVSVNIGTSGFSCNCFVLSCSYNAVEEKYSVSLVSYGDVSVDVAKLHFQSSVGDSNYQILDSIITGSGTATQIVPAADVPTNLSAVASKDYISLSCALDNNGISSASKIIWQIKKESQNWADAIEFTSSFNAEYIFNRDIDGYPEASELEAWEVRAKTVNNYEKYSAWSDSVSINVDSYGTWHIPNLTTDNVQKQEMDRVVILKMNVSQPSIKLYGNPKYKVSIKLVGISKAKSTDPDSDYEDVEYTPDTNFYKPDLYSSALDSETAYKTSEVNGFVTVDETYTQTLPLAGQSQNKAVNTIYQYKVSAYNESGYETNAVTFNATALCTSLRDIVKSKANYKDLYVEKLSAISANVGLISQGGFGSFDSWSNFWALSDIPSVDAGTENDVIRGTFKVGDNNEYISVTPVTISGEPATRYSDVDHYAIEIKAGDISLTNKGVDLSSGTFIYKDKDKTRRLSLTSNGIIFQSLINNVWTEDGKIIEDDFKNVFITNSKDKENLNLIVENGTIYHFDKNVLDEDGGNGANIETSGEIVNDSSAKMDTKVFNGIIKKQIPQNTFNEKFYILTKTNAISLKDYIFFEDGNSYEEARSLNDRMTTKWGLTQEQVNSRLFTY